MRKLLPYLPLITILLVGASVFALPQPAHADAASTVLDWATGGTDFVYGILGKLIWWAIVPITGFVVWLTGMMIDVIITLSSDPAFYNSPAISTSWGIIRDIANMFFIFILIFHGLQVILNRGNLATIQKTIGGLILAAVFINFSLFATKAVIDVSNITAAWFVKGIYAVGGEASVSGSVRATLQMDKLLGGASSADAQSWTNFSSQQFATGIAAIALNCVAAYVFFQVFFLLLARLVAFMFLLITAPIGFVGFLLPQLKDYASEWWSELNGQAMLAPMFFLMLYITLYLVDQMNTNIFGVTGQNATDPTTGTTFSPTNYVMFALIIMMLLKTLSIAKKYSGELGKNIGGALKSATLVGFGGLAGASSLFTRGLVRGGIGAAEKLGDKTATGSARERLFSGFKSGAGSIIPTMPKMPSLKDMAKNGTWDIRNAIPAAGGTFLKTGQSILTGKADSSLGLLDAKALKTRDKEWKEGAELKKTEISILEDIRNIEEQQNKIATGTLSAADRATVEAKIQGHQDSISTSLSKTSNKDLEKMDKDGVLTNEHVLNLMSAEEIAHLTEKSELSEAIKGKIRGIREKGLKTAMEAGRPDEVKKALKKLSKKEKEGLSNDILNLDMNVPANAAKIKTLVSPEAMSPDDFEILMKSDSIVPGNKKKLREARHKPLKDVLAAVPRPTADQVGRDASLITGAQGILSKFKDGEISKMDKEILQDPRISVLLSTQALTKLIDSDDFNDADRAVIRDNIITAAGALGPAGHVGNSQKLANWLMDDNKGKYF
ncbi:MAG: hypothetical protein WC763_02620 [Candidatus Paceibacterota bacterium]|jgi:hypothetical protein